MSWSSSATPLTDTLLELGQQKELTSELAACMGEAKIDEGMSDSPARFKAPDVER
jgi:hypothetical protein